MKSHSFAQTHDTGHTASALPLLVGALLLISAGGCGPAEEPIQTPRPLELGTSVQDIEEDNGLTLNGLAFNGLAFNGLAFNGLAFNGLTNSAFSSWFQQDPVTANVVMKYLVRCALPAGQSRTYANGSITYTWDGNLGLAPNWAGGSPATLAEQQIITACLAALTNKFGQTVSISVLGANALGQLIPYTSAELSDYPLREACFFGNVFNNEGFFVGNDQPLLSPSQSSLRACALEGSDQCPPLVHVGNCQSSCTLDPTGTYFIQCSRGGKAYRPITTRLRTQELYTCGDGTCQSTESCGSSNRHNDCALDCGPCH